MTEKRAKAIKLLEAMVEPCEHQRKSGEHEWRKCRRCLAHREAETAHGVELLVVLLTELQFGRRPRSLPECINCYAAFDSTSYGFGPSTPPGAERREVGPLCEKCYNLIYVHIGVKRHA